MEARSTTTGCMTAAPLWTTFKATVDVLGKSTKRGRRGEKGDRRGVGGEEDRRGEEEANSLHVKNLYRRRVFGMERV